TKDACRGLLCLHKIREQGDTLLSCVRKTEQIFDVFSFYPNTVFSIKDDFPVLVRSDRYEHLFACTKSNCSAILNQSISQKVMVSNRPLIDCVLYLEVRVDGILRGSCKGHFCVIED
ncbi:hypothetical protein PFISCL1PPCAC_13407, partial [Pristionchus fissidentatus]